MSLTLVIQGDGFGGRTIVLQPGERRSFGRKDADISLPHDALLSGVHFMVECTGEGGRLTDLGSTNGTLLNGKIVAGALLADGDEVTAGATRIRVSVGGKHAAVAVEPQPFDPRTLYERLAGQQLYGLLDAARDTQVLATLRLHRERYQSLYEGQQGEALAEAAPYLVRFSTPSPLLRTWVEQHWGKSWGVLLSSQESFEKVRTHFRRFLLVSTEDGQELYFRFYDPRVLREFLPTCTPEERGTFFGPVEKFYTEGDNTEQLVEFSPEGVLLAASEARDS